MPSIRDEITRTLFRFSRRHSEPPPPSVVWLSPKAQIGQYRVVRRLGSGGMGQVYLALDTKLNRHVALKVLAPHLTEDPAHVARFKQEAYAASALTHPNILTIFDFWEIDGAQIIVSEYVEGITLRTALEEHVFNVGQALDIAAQIGSALEAAHSAGVVHRDLKPTNIMLRPDGYVKVIDFGLAKLAERSGNTYGADVTLTRPGTVVGTLRYMSPEQARGEEVDHRSDLWSLGVILYEMVTGHAPFEGATDNHVVVAILDSSPRPVPTNLLLPHKLQQVLERSLKKNKRERYQSARDFVADLQIVQPEQSGTSTVHLRRKPISRRRRWILATGLGAVLTVLFVWWGSSQVRGSNWFQVAQTERVTFDGNVRTAMLSPDGHWLAYATGATGSEALHLRALGSGEERTLPPSEQSYSGLTFSPDARTLFYVLRDPREELGTLFSLPVAEFGTAPAAMEIRDVDGPIAFAPDGHSFAFLRRSEMQAADTAKIYVVPLSDLHRERVVASLRGTQVYGELAWSRAGIAAVVFPFPIGRPSQASVYLFSPEGKLISETASPRFRRLRYPVFAADGRSLFVSALTQGAAQYRLEQVFFRTGQWHTVASDLAGFEQLSTTASGEVLSAVRETARSSVWIANKEALGQPMRLTPDTENFTSLAWLNDGRLIVPSARTGDENLMAVDQNGAIEAIGERREAFETSPATVPGTPEVVYTSNEGEGGNDFNIWKVIPGKGAPMPVTRGSNVDVTPQITPDGRWVIYTAFVGGQTLWRVPLSGGTPSEISRYRVRSPFVSPDGKSVVCEIREPAGDWRVAILSLADGKLVREMPDLPIGGLTRWSPDGTAVDYVVHQNGSSAIWRKPLDGGEARSLLRVPDMNLVFFAWSPDGNKLAYIVGRVETDVVLLHASAHSQ